MTHRDACLLGALVADAASLGLHWIYEPERIASVAGDDPAFLPINPANYKDVRGYFAHEQRRDGQLSQYGECLALALDCVTDSGFDVAGYQSRFTAFFGAGGGYQGYIDRPTRATLDNIANGQTAPSGVADDQHPAITRLPLMAVLGASEPQIIDAIRITNVDDTATEYGLLCAELLRLVLTGTSLPDALSATAGTGLLRAALDTTETDSTVYGGVTARACHLPQGVPLAFHILKHATGYTDAIRRNILAGGDSCGRAILIGAVMGAVYGIATPTGIPLGYILKTTDAPRLWPLITRQAGM